MGDAKAPKENAKDAKVESVEFSEQEESVEISGEQGELEEPKKKTVKKITTLEVDVKKLLEAGAHFGHQTHRWNPKMAPYIFTKRNNIHIIDLFKTVEKLNEALAFITKNVSEGGSVLFVGTKNQAKDIIKEEALRTNSPYISEKWLGGMLTNFSTVTSRIKHMDALEKALKEGDFVTKKEGLDIEEDLAKLNENFGGIREMKKMPSIIFIVDAHKEGNAIKEAKRLDIKTVAIVDTNTNPELVDYAIPANDDAIKAIKYITGLVADAVVAGKAGMKE